MGNDTIGIVAAAVLMISTMTSETISSPPDKPVGERQVVTKSAYADQCFVAARKMATREGWLLGTPLVTKSKKWGIVWRVGFTTKSHRRFAPVNKIVCWRDSDGKSNFEIVWGSPDGND